MNPYDINDKRLKKDFKGMTFSIFKKSAAKKQLLNNLKNGEIESCCYWAAEYICAGHFMDLWELIFLYVSKNIHLGNPKIALYLNMRYQIYENILDIGYTENEFRMRNNSKIRKLFAEMISIICLSKKKNPFVVIKVKEDDYNIAKISYKLKADSVKYGQSIFMKEDPKELYIAINELAWAINSRNKKSNLAYYWIEWVLGYDNICKKNKQEIQECGRRKIEVNVDYQKDNVWIIWDTLLHEANKKDQSILKIIKALKSLYCIKYTPGLKKRRRFILYYAVSFLTEPLEDVKLIKSDADKKTIMNVTSNINMVYKEIKKNEILPSTDYLFNNSFTKGNLEKTISKLEKINSLIDQKK